MKKSMLILILTALLTSCKIAENPPKTAEIPTAQTVTETSDSEEESCTVAETQPSTECEILTTEMTVTTVEFQSETVCTTSVTDVQKEKSQYNPTEAQKEKTVEIPTDYTEPNNENRTEKFDIPVQTEPLQTIENTPFTEVSTEEYREETQSPECSLSDYEKALEVYNFMTANGSGTCVQYSWQTYEMCCEIGLESYFAWTENQLYGHVANVIKIDGVWYVLDTQAGCFLTENICGFTEIVDENESYIANADIISSVRYE